MNTFTSRDTVFADLHATALKPSGFRKRGHWAIRNEADTIQTVYLRASRFGNSAKAIFWIDIQVFHAGWYELLFAPKVFSSPKEGVPSLLTEELGKLCEPPMNALAITPDTSTDALTENLRNALVGKAIPLLDQCSTLEGVLGYYVGRNNPKTDALSTAAVLLLLGRDKEARNSMALAKSLASHENDLRWLELREKSMWAELKENNAV